MMLIHYVHSTSSMMSSVGQSSRLLSFSAQESYHSSNHQSLTTKSKLLVGLNQEVQDSLKLQWKQLDSLHASLLILHGTI